MRPRGRSFPEVLAVGLVAAGVALLMMGYLTRFDGSMIRTRAQAYLKGMVKHEALYGAGDPAAVTVHIEDVQRRGAEAVVTAKIRHEREWIRTSLQMNRDSRGTWRVAGVLSIQPSSGLVAKAAETPSEPEAPAEFSEQVRTAFQNADGVDVQRY
ncbi:hypothetical protein [Rubinisphaera margarita]|uniref:hypothetical protein n=1 Tax=Rubinisphaera margarita TaxID=2909586 RepID=UPI001EE7DA23|nr:hypothetical protein [Rubinisphaera margarita]MCG6154791.1 hypothetical protein [Rubinisphaera margarita]